MSYTRSGILANMYNNKYMERTSAASSTLHTIVHFKYLFYYYNVLGAKKKSSRKGRVNTKELFTMGNKRQQKKKNIYEKVEYLQRSSVALATCICAIVVY